MASAALKTEQKTPDMDTGIKAGQRTEVGQALANVLADTYLLYLKTQGVHWNITGPRFYSMHKLTEEQYEDLSEAIDALAERIRALGLHAPAAFGDYQRLSILDSSETDEEADAMIKALIQDNEAVAKRLRDYVEIAEDNGDVFTADMLTARIGRHEENAWMLRASI